MANIEKIKQILNRRCDYKWKIQSMKYGKALCVPFIDARDCCEILDSAVGPNNWQNSYESIDVFWPQDQDWQHKPDDQGPEPRHANTRKALYCTVSVRYHEDWIHKSDMGDPTAVDPHKGEASDAFKRACVKHGVGRFLYSIKPVQLSIGDYKGRKYPTTKQGNLLLNQDDLTEYICELVSNRPEDMKTGPLKTKMEEKGIVQSNCKDWRDFVMHFGKFKGTNLGWILENDRSYLHFLRTTWIEKKQSTQEKYPLSETDRQLLIAIQGYEKFKDEEDGKKEAEQKIRQQQETKAMHPTETTAGWTNPPEPLDLFRDREPPAGFADDIPM